MVDEKGAPHILDFGLSQTIDQAFETISREGVPLGTPAYMSPEQVKGARQELDKRTDTYSIGIILYQALTDKLPFVGQKADVFRKILEQTPPPPRKFNSKISPALNSITLKAISKDPAYRYQNAGEMAEDIRRYLAGQIVQARPQIDARILKAQFSKYWMAIAVALLSIVCFLLYFYQPADSFNDD